MNEICFLDLWLQTCAHIYMYVCVCECARSSACVCIYVCLSGSFSLARARSLSLSRARALSLISISRVQVAAFTIGGRNDQTNEIAQAIFRMCSLIFVECFLLQQWISAINIACHSRFQNFWLEATPFCSKYTSTPTFGEFLQTNKTQKIKTLAHPLLKISARALPSASGTMSLGYYNTSRMRLVGSQLPEAILHWPAGRVAKEAY